MVEAWRKLLEGVAAPARLVKRVEEERRFEREKEEEEEIAKRKAQEEKKPICSECSKDQSKKNRDRHHDVTLASTLSPHLGEMVGKSKKKKEQETGGVEVPPASSEATWQEEVGTTQTTTEVNL